MLNYHYKKISYITGLFLIAFMVLSITVQAAQEIAQSERITKCIAVIPFQSLTPAREAGAAIFCPCDAGSSSGKILKESEKIVEEVFVNKLRDIKGIELISSEKVQAVYKKISSGKMKGNRVEIFKKVGKELGADFLAIGCVYRYNERVGSSYSSEHPASVFFEIRLVKTDDCSVIWRGFFDKTQKSLMENVFEISSFFKGGAKWVTASQLTEQGMNDIFKTFPDFLN
ncbi:MAG: hypothetical protein JW976_02825 [Syntrophaceae bacterium]|nr:hypothetical protein [Syntrophaceae bacterium]